MGRRVDIHLRQNETKWDKDEHQEASGDKIGQRAADVHVGERVSVKPAENGFEISSLKT